MDGSLMACFMMFLFYGLSVSETGVWGRAKSDRRNLTFALTTLFYEDTHMYDTIDTREGA